MSSPREVIARAIFHADYDEDESWEDCSDLHLVYFKIADAVIDALEGMEVTDKMIDAAMCGTVNETSAVAIWRAMVGAMRDES